MAVLQSLVPLSDAPLSSSKKTSVRVSYVIVTYNRREALLKTLAHLYATTPLPPEAWEVWIVDNASTDGTEAAVRAAYPNPPSPLNYLMRANNEGVCARSHAFAPARGEYLILLDDDSYPINDAVTRSLAYMDATPNCAAVVGKVLLPDGTGEGCAFPAVMLSGAVCIRKSALAHIKGGGVFRPEFFRKAGEYDLSYRIWQAGFTVERFEDIVYRHDKVLTGRSKPFAHRMDLRNNLILVERYLPKHLRPIYRTDIIQRYTALARHEACSRAALQARLEGFLWRVREALTGRQTLTPETIEKIYTLNSQATEVSAFARQYNARTAVITDFSKNLHATFAACTRANLRVLAIADNAPAFKNLTYNGVPVLTLTAAALTAPDVVVVSNINPAQCQHKTAAAKATFPVPVLALWQPSYSATAEPIPAAA